ncbi:MAG: hypothetical protein JWO31_2218 [Phycisphaerales bacterium]|nr:hypothetical protein [Phycisphaerales bacterium]
MRAGRSLAASGDGKALAAAGPGRNWPWLVALPDGALLDPGMECGWVKAVAFAPGGNWFAGGSHGGDIYHRKVGK